ncbi:hypothetical protein ACIPW5_11235 [Streptomyces sp. NPDC090077]|uniref:hypothetical protein n=1 Tax=Streptomyces sp. NPDC090077 TaxID=3365938 RepID=UPI00383078E5
MNQMVAPWTSQQVQALNDYQATGDGPVYTCFALHASGRSPALDATHSGWVCPDPDCDYPQENWAWDHTTTPPAA